MTTTAVPKTSLSARAPSRIGKKVVAGYYSPKLSKRLRFLALAQKTSVQALLGEAIDLLMVKNGQRALGER